MTTNKYTGVFQLPNGHYGYRVVINRKDLKIDTTYRQDENGNPFKTKAAARDAREKKIVEFKNQPKQEESKIKNLKLADIYNHYMEQGSSDKAFATIKKQKSMWENHIKSKFGDLYIKDITLNDIQNYINDLYKIGDAYSDTPYSYKYVEGFLKFFYLLYGYAYKQNAIDTETYTKSFLDKKTRLSMPKMTQEDQENYDDLKVFTLYEIKQMENLIKGSNFHLPFLMGYYCGLRLSETYALKIEDIDIENQKLNVNKQLLYQDGAWVLAPVKTLKSVRNIDLPDNLFKMLKQHIIKIMFERENNPNYRNFETVIDKTKRESKKLVGDTFLFRKENGELLTTNSVKYWSKEIKAQLGIDFKYHSLRKTHATIMASLNTPIIELMNRMGHKKIDTTMKYYIKDNMFSNEKLKSNINNLDFQGAEPITSVINPDEL